MKISVRFRLMPATTGRSDAFSLLLCRAWFWWRPGVDGVVPGMEARSHFLSTVEKTRRSSSICSVQRWLIMLGRWIAPMEKK